MEVLENRYFHRRPFASRAWYNVRFVASENEIKKKIEKKRKTDNIDLLWPRNMSIRMCVCVCVCCA